MQKTLSHLPKTKKDDLAKIVEIIRNNEKDIAMIILFGSYATGKYKEKKDLEPQRWSGHISDYDILVITGSYETVRNRERWLKIQKKLSEDRLAEKFTATPRVIMHDINDVNAMLTLDQYFFKDIKEEGILLFDSGEFTLAEAKELTEAEKKTIARGYFNDKFGTAEEFYEFFKVGFKRGENLAKKDEYSESAQKAFKLSSFQLHQAAEHAYKAILLVFTNYCPDEHYLDKLSFRASKHVPEIADIFEDDYDRFVLLNKAYIGARYMPSTDPLKYPPLYAFDIYKEDLEALAPKVKELLDLTKKFCLKKIGD